MKVLIVAPYFYPHVGGLESYVYNISKGLIKAGNWKVVVVTSNHEQKVYKEEIIEGIKVYRLPRWIKLSNTPINPLWYFMIKKIIKAEKPHLINTHTPVPFIADITALAANTIPLIVTYHAHSLLKGKFLADIISSTYEKIFLKLLLKRANKIICVSQYVRNTSLREYKKKSIVITPGVDTKLFKPSTTQVSKNNILCIGGLKKAENYKRLEDIFLAINILKDKGISANLTILGEGDNKDYFKSLDKKLHIEKQVTFAGHLLNRNLVDQYHRATVLVLASINESFGMVLIEAMACKVPVICANASGIKYIIKHKDNGLFFKPKDIVSLSENLEIIFSNKELVTHLRNNAYKYIQENYQWKDKNVLTQNVFNSLL